MSSRIRSETLEEDQSRGDTVYGQEPLQISVTLGRSFRGLSDKLHLRLDLIGIGHSVDGDDSVVGLQRILEDMMYYATTYLILC